MSDEEIYEALGITDAFEEDKQATLHNINTVVELKAVQLMSDLLSDEEVTHIEEMEKNGLSKDDILWWLGENVASAHEMIDALKRDYVGELARKYHR